jgi:hypothetical protein
MWMMVAPLVLQETKRGLKPLQGFPLQYTWSICLILLSIVAEF